MRMKTLVGKLKDEIKVCILGLGTIRCVRKHSNHSHKHDRFADVIGI